MKYTVTIYRYSPSAFVDSVDEVIEAHSASDIQAMLDSRRGMHARLEARDIRVEPTTEKTAPLMEFQERERRIWDFAFALAIPKDDSIAHNSQYAREARKNAAERANAVLATFMRACTEGLAAK